MHPEHAEHYRRNRVVRMGGRDVARTTVVVRCGPIRKARLLAALWLMKIAGRVGGFRSVKFVSEKT